MRLRVGAEPRLSFAEHAPADACLAVFSGDVAATCGAFQKTRIGKQLCGPEFRPLVAALANLELAGPLHLRPAFGFDWNDLAKVHDAGGLVIFPLKDGSSGAAWIFTPAEPRREPAECLTAAGRYFEQKDFRSTSMQRKDVNLTLLQPPAARKSESPRVLFTAATFYGVANSQAAAEAVLATAANRSLAGQAGLKESLPPAESQAATADVSLFVKPFELLELMTRAAHEENKTPAKPTAKGGKTKTANRPPREDEPAAAKRLGFTAIESLAGRVSFGADAPCEWSATATIRAAGPYRGALRVLELRPGPLAELPSWINADVMTAGRWRWDFPLAMKGFGSLYDQANEPGPDGEGLFEDLLDGLRDDPEGVQVDLRRNLFEQLTGEVLRISDGGRPATTEDAASQRWLYVAGVRDATKVKEALSRFYQSDKRVEHAQRGAYDVWTVGPGASLFVEGESDSLVTVRGLALGQDQLLFATDVDLLESALAGGGDGPKLRDDQSWMRLLEWIARQHGEATALESLVRLDRALESSYRTAIAEPLPKKPADSRDAKASENEPLGGRLWRVLLFGTSKNDAPLPRSAAPKFEAFSDALPQGAIVISRVPDGWNIRFGVLGPTDQPTP